MKEAWAGIDLGLQTAALAILAGQVSGPWELLQVKVLSFPPASVEERLSQYHTWLKGELHAINPACMKGVFAEMPFAGKNIRSALLLGTLQGVTWAILKEVGWPELKLLSALQVKKALTGRGSASKAQVARWLQHYLISPATLPHNHHATDAIAIAIAGALSQNSAMTRTFTSRAER